MSIENVPLDVFTTVIDDVLTASTWSEGLELRKVNSKSIGEMALTLSGAVSLPFG